MFRLHKSKHSHVKSGERINFKMTQFEAIEVPKGWDKLFVSIISVETGKAVAKTSKAAVRNGTCQWTDSVSDSIWIPMGNQSHSSMEHEYCPYKFMLSMGSTRSGILGEVVMNMAAYMSSSDSFPVSLPLNKCSHGTILQLKIQCLTPRASPRDFGSQSAKEDHNVSSTDEVIKSGDDSDNTLDKSARSYSSKDLSTSSHEEDDEKGGAKGVPEEGSFISSGSHHSYNSAEISIEKEGFSPTSNSNGVENKLMATQDSTSLRNSVPPGSSDVENTSQSDYSLRSTHSENLSQDDPLKFSAASLGISGSSRSLLEAAEDTIEELQSEAKHWERNARKLMLDLEMLSKKYSEQSKILVNLDMELSAARAERDCFQKEALNLKHLLEKASELHDKTVQDSGLANVVREMENEIRFLKETLDHLTQQLQRSQESNFELVSVLQELEETTEKKTTETGNVEGNAAIQDLVQQAQQLQESEKNLQAKVQELEKAIEAKDQTISDIEVEYQLKLSESLNKRKNSAGLESSEGCDKSLINEIELLKAKMQELESDCQELTDENLELLLKLKKISAENGSLMNSRPEEKDHESEMHGLEEKMKTIETDHCLEIEVLERKIAELNKELCEKRDRLKVDLASKEKEIGNLQTCQAELEGNLCAFQDEKGKLEENVEVVTKESDVAIECLTDLQNDKMVLSSTVKTHLSANKVRERKSSELEDAKRELEVQLSELEQENEELSACISMLEAQIQNLTDDRKSIALELHNSRSNTLTLQDEIARLRNQMQTQETDARRKLEDINYRRSEDQEELENLRNENPKLQATAESLIKNCGTLQNSVRQLRMHNLVQQEHCDNLEAKLSETQRNFADCSKRVNVLQENLCSLVEESTSKERSLTAELDALLKENDTQNKKIIVLDQMHTEKSIEVENLRQELEDLNRQLCLTRDEKDRQASASEKEVSDLRTNIGKLETELKTTQIESKANIEDLMDELTSSKQNQEMLKTEMVKMSNSLENYKSREENFKTTLSSLELKLTVSEYEHQQRTEETTKLKAQLVKMESLENEVVTLRNEKQKLETSLNKKSEECRELNIEKSSCTEKITELQKNVAELEDCRQDKITLEQRIEKLECSLIANEAFGEQDIELRKELSWMKRSNKQLQQQIQQLEEEKQKLKTTNQSLEEELIWMKEKQRNIKDSNSLRSPNYQNLREGDKLMDDELSKSKESRNAFKVQLKTLTSEERKSRPGLLKNTKGDVELVAKEKFERTKSSLESELRELQERYLDMSLKYAQVEAEREELVMKLRGNNNGTKCF